MGLLYYVSYLALLSAFGFVTLSLASGLLYVSELIEEHSRLAKTIGQRTIYAIIALHAVFYFTDSLPFFHILFSIFCHGVYLQNFSSTWPLISLTSLNFLGSCLLVVADHFMWFFYFSRVTSEARGMRNYRGERTHVHGFSEIATFFGLCVWLAPLFLFLSLSANDNALPTMGGPTVASSSPGQPLETQTGRRTTLLRSIFSFLSIRRKDPSEGLIAPRPAPAMRPSSPAPMRGPASPMLYSPIDFSVPPRSPGPRSFMAAAEGHVPGAGGFKLDPPPVSRTMSQPGLSRNASGAGLGLRRSGATKDD